MPNDNPMLDNVIVRIMEIGDLDFDGEIDANLLAIFAKLSIREKKILLRGMLKLYHQVKTSEEDKVSSTCTTDENSVESFNNKLLIRFKVWVLKIITMAYLLYLILRNVFIDSGVEAADGETESLVTLLKLLLT